MVHVHLDLVVHGVFIAFFAWLLLHALVFHSKSSTSLWGPSLIEGLDATTATTATTAPTTTATTAPTTTAPTTTAPTTTAPTTTATATTAPLSQVQMDENTAEIAVLKGQIATLMQTAQTLKAQMLQNETGIQNNTQSIQKVVQSQTDMNNKLAASKSKQ
jgi:flagellar motility protein MotE (MotC chaperone)